MRLRVLTHTFPPSAHANAKRPFYVVRHALAEGWEVEVITSFWGMSRNGGECLQHPRLRVHRRDDPVLRWQERLRPWPGLHRAVVYLTGAVLFPDACVGWVRRVLREWRQQPPADRTVVSVLPASFLLAGRVGAGVDRSWVFDYQEPVSPQQLRVRRRSPLQRLWRQRLESLERATLHRVGRVLFTAETNRQAYVGMGLVPGGRTAHVPYFYDSTVFDGPPLRPHSGFEVVYFGTFDWRGARSPETFLRAWAEFLAAHPEARPRARFRFHGQWPARYDGWIRELGLEDVFVRGPILGHDRYLEEVRRSPILLLVVSPVHDLFMPSKIVDYLGARRPLLALVPGGSEMHGLLVRAGFEKFCADPLDVAGARGVLERLWRAYCERALVAPAGEVTFWSSAVQLPIYWQQVVEAVCDPATGREATW